MDERDVRQINSSLCRRASVTAQRDVADRFTRLIGQSVLLARYRIEFRMSGKTGLEHAVEVGTGDTFQFIIELDRKTSCLDKRV